MMKSKSDLAIVLSKLKLFEKPSQYREQYTMDPETGASVLWFAFMRGDIKNKVVADLGAGTGLLGIGAFLLGAKRVFLVEIDEKAVDIIKENIEIINEFIKNIKIKNKIIKNKKIINKIIIINDDIKNFNENVETVIQNPPFGVKKRHADKIFLKKAFEISEVVYSFHKIDSSNFIDNISKKNNFQITNILRFDLPIKQTMKYHKKRIYRFKVGCWRMEKIKNRK